MEKPIQAEVGELAAVMTAAQPHRTFRGALWNKSQNCLPEECKTFIRQLPNPPLVKGGCMGIDSMDFWVMYAQVPSVSS